MMKKLRYPFIALFALTFTFSACSSSSSDDNEEPLLPPNARIRIMRSATSKIEPFKEVAYFADGAKKYGINRTEWIVEHKSKENSLEYVDFVHYLPGQHQIKANFYKQGQLVAKDSIMVTVVEPIGDFMFLWLSPSNGDSAYFENDTIALNLQQYPRKNSDDNIAFSYALLTCEVKPKFAEGLHVREFFDNYMTALYGEKLFTDADETGSLAEDFKFVIRKDGELVLDVWRKQGKASAFTIKRLDGSYYVVAMRSR